MHHDLLGRGLTAAAATAAGAVAAGAVTAGVLTAQGLAARRAAGPRTTVPPYADGRYGGNEGISLRLAVLGDSLSAGLGCEYPHETPGAIIARRLSRKAGRPVILSNIGVVGARSDHLAEQVDRALITRPHLAIIIVGANDVTHMIPHRWAAKRLRIAVRRLRAVGTQVIVGTCPDLGTVRIIGPPARNVVRRNSRLLARAQTLVTVQEGGYTVSLADSLGAEFAARPGDLFSPDRYHPNAEGYAALGEILTPAAFQALNLEGALLPARYERPLSEPLDQAATEAVLLSGTILHGDSAPSSHMITRVYRRLWRRGEDERDRTEGDHPGALAV